MQIFIYYKATPHVSGATTPIIRSSKNCNRILQYTSYYLYRYSPPTWPDSPDHATLEEVALPVLWPVPEAAVTVFSTPDNGCCGARNM